MRPYLGPWILSVILTASIIAWGISEWGQIQTGQLERAKRFGEMFSVFIDANLHQQPHNDPFKNPDYAQNVLRSFIAQTPPIGEVTLSLDGEVIASASRTAPSPFEDAFETLAFRYPMRRNLSQPLKMPPSLSSPGTPQPEPDPRVLTDGPILSLTVDVAPALSTNRGKAMVWKLLLALGGMIGLCSTWAMRIRQQRDASALAIERQRRSHLEELSVAAAGLAHETKNPLGIILGIAQRIRDAPTTDDATRHFAEQIIDAADRAAERLGEFMNFARINEPTLADANARDVIGSIVDVLGYDFEADGVKLSVDCAPLSIRCDPSMLKQVLVNLLLNSLEACDPGAEVTVSLKLEGASKAALVVADRGRGIPADLRPDVFKPYVTGRADGHGLGLAIVSRIVERHGWHISLESEVGQGTRISIQGIAVCPEPSLSPLGASSYDQASANR